MAKDERTTMIPFVAEEDPENDVIVTKNKVQPYFAVLYMSHQCHFWQFYSLSAFP